MVPEVDRHYSPLQHKTGKKQGQSVSPHNGQDQVGGYGQFKEDSSPNSKKAKRGGNNESNNNNCNQPTA